MLRRGSTPTGLGMAAREAAVRPGLDHVVDGRDAFVARVDEIVDELTVGQRDATPAPVGDAELVERSIAAVAVEIDAAVDGEAAPVAHLEPGRPRLRDDDRRPPMRVAARARRIRCRALRPRGAQRAGESPTPRHVDVDRKPPATRPHPASTPRSGSVRTASSPKGSSRRRPARRSATKRRRVDLGRRERAPSWAYARASGDRGSRARTATRRTK